MSARRYFEDFRVRIALAATSIALAASIIVSAFSIVRAVSLAESSLTIRGEDLAEWLSGEVVLGVLAENKDQVEEQARRFVKLRDVAGVVILRNGKPFVAMGRVPPSLGARAEGLIDESDARVSRAPIVLEPGAVAAEGIGPSTAPKTLGTVAIVLARTRLRESIVRFVLLSCLITIGVIGLAIAASALTARRIAGPVQRLIIAAEELRAGKRAVQVPVESADAIGRLSATFNRMAAEVQRASEELERRLDELVAANKELETFSYSVSHDLRAPLRHIDGFTDILRQRASSSLSSESQRYLNVISEEAARLGNLIDNLLGLSRVGRVQIRKTRVNLRQLVDAVRSELSPEYEKRTVEWQIGDLPEVQGDPTLLRSAVTNLLSNAIKYTRPRQHARIEIGCEVHERDVVCFVRDNGVGFDMRYVDKLFGPFQRLHRAEDFEGTGIGLATVRRVIQRHGGRTWAEGEEGKGATFFFLLPRWSVVEGGPRTSN